MFRRLSVTAPAPPETVAATATDAAGAITVEFRKSGLSAVWEDSGSLLDFAEKHGLSPDFSCRAGVCGSCQVALLQGEVAYFQEPLDAPDKGNVLICSYKPKGSVVIEL